MNCTYRLVREVVDDAPGIKVTGCNDAARYLYANCYRSEDMGRESCWALMLNAANEITGRFLVAQGTDNACQIDHKAICKAAIDSYACAVILSHNHPSGSCRPSGKDITETAKLKRALDCLGISLLDHIIVADREYYSYAEEKASRKPRTPESKPIAVEDLFTAEDIERLNNIAWRAFASAIL